MEFKRLKDSMISREYNEFAFLLNPAYPDTNTIDPQGVYEELIQELAQHYVDDGFTSEYINDPDFVERGLLLHKLANENRGYMWLLNGISLAAKLNKREKDILSYLFNPQDISELICKIRREKISEKNNIQTTNNFISAIAALKSQGTMTVDTESNSITIALKGDNFDLAHSISVLFENRLNPMNIFLYSEREHDLICFRDIIIRGLHLQQSIHDWSYEVQDVMKGYTECLSQLFYAQQRFTKEDEKEFKISQELQDIKENIKETNTKEMDIFVAIMEIAEQYYESNFLEQLCSVERVSTMGATDTTNEF